VYSSLLSFYHTANFSQVPILLDPGHLDSRKSEAQYVEMLIYGWLVEHLLGRGI